MPENEVGRPFAGSVREDDGGGSGLLQDHVAFDGRCLAVFGVLDDQIATGRAVAEDLEDYDWIGHDVSSREHRRADYKRVRVSDPAGDLDFQLAAMWTTGFTAKPDG